MDGVRGRSAILEVLDLSGPGVVTRLEKLKKRLKIIIDDSKDHGEDGSGENQAAARLLISAGAGNEAAPHVVASAQ